MSSSKIPRKIPLSAQNVSITVPCGPIYLVPFFGGGIFKLLPLPFPIFDLEHVQCTLYSSSDHFDTDEQLFARTAFTWLAPLADC